MSCNVSFRDVLRKYTAMWQIVPHRLWGRVMLCVLISQRCWLVQAYPPPVAGGAPSATNSVFCDMNSEQWEEFMLALTHLIREGLKHGRWRQDVKKGKGTHAMQNMGVSCPRF